MDRKKMAAFLEKYPNAREDHYRLMVDEEMDAAAIRRGANRAEEIAESQDRIHRWADEAGAGEHRGAYSWIIVSRRQSAAWAIAIGREAKGGE